MFKFSVHIPFFVFSLAVLCIDAPVTDAWAACSPGIPCTDYDVSDDTANASKAGGSGACDANFMNRIYSRAFMEASRDVVLSEQLIHKPDSVLEYTCFDQRIALSAHNAGPIFSESPAWRNVTIPLWTGGYNTTASGIIPDRGSSETINNTGATDGFDNQEEYAVFSDVRLDEVLGDLLLDTLENYIEGSFSHTFLGEATTIDNSLKTDSIGANSYSCAHMGTVWHIAKCIDFGEDDRFRSFEHLVNYDPRSIPQACSPGHVSDDTITAGDDATKTENIAVGASGEEGEGGMPSGGMINPCPEPGGVEGDVNTGGFSNDAIRLANNCDVDGNPHPYSSFDIVQSYNAMLKGAGEYDEGAADTSAENVTQEGEKVTITCAPPIPTGVPVITYRFEDAVVQGYSIKTVKRIPEFHYEYICPNPGCYYAPNKLAYTLGDPVPALPASKGVCKPIGTEEEEDG